MFRRVIHPRPAAMRPRSLVGPVAAYT